MNALILLIEWLLTDRVARMTSAQGAHSRHDTGDIDPLCPPTVPRSGFGQQQQGGLAFGGPRGRGDIDIRHQAVTIVQQHMAGIRQRPIFQRRLLTPVGA
jgi:hypothetical protein